MVKWLCGNNLGIIGLRQLKNYLLQAQIVNLKFEPVVDTY